MHLHAALRDDASFIGTLKRQLSRRGSIKKQGRERSGSTATGAKPSLLYLDMSQHVDWEARTEAFLDETATRPSQTTLLLEIPELQGICVNHGERHIRIERREVITVRDVLIELDKFLHRPAPKLVGNFKTAKVTVDADADADALLEQPRSPKAIDLEVSESPDSSESSLNSQGEKKPRESVLKSWMDGKTMFAGLRQAENHDFKLYVRMVRPGKESSLQA